MKIKVTKYHTPKLEKQPSSLNISELYIQRYESFFISVRDNHFVFEKYTFVTIHKIKNENFIIMIIFKI